MEHSYGGLCLLPAFADAAVVFDDIHSYDRTMWNALVTFLNRFDVPVLCMTATLPPSRRTQIERHLRTYPTPADMTELKDSADAESHARYLLSSTTKEDAVVAAVAAVQAGQRVLWVVNTVKRCQQLARTMAANRGAVSVRGITPASSCRIGNDVIGRPSMHFGHCPTRTARLLSP